MQAALQQSIGEQYIEILYMGLLKKQNLISSSESTSDP